MEMANARGIKVIEDVSHAHGARYKGQLVGTIGHVGAMSCMSGKAFAIGEAGMLITDDQEIYERAIAFGHYERTRQIEHPGATEAVRSAAGWLQVSHEPVVIGGWPGAVEALPGAHGGNPAGDELLLGPAGRGAGGFGRTRPPPDSDSTMGGWYSPHGLYVPEELGGLSVAAFCAAVSAEGARTSPGANFLLHQHPVLNEADVYGHGTPTRIAHADRDVRQDAATLPKSDSLPERVYSIPWFKHYRPGDHPGARGGVPQGGRPSGSTAGSELRDVRSPYGPPRCGRGTTARAVVALGDDVFPPPSRRGEGEGGGPELVNPPGRRLYSALVKTFTRGGAAAHVS